MHKISAEKLINKVKMPSFLIKVDKLSGDLFYQDKQPFFLVFWHFLSVFLFLKLENWILVGLAGDDSRPQKWSDSRTLIT